MPSFFFFFGLIINSKQAGIFKQKSLKYLCEHSYENKWDHLCQQLYKYVWPTVCEIKSKLSKVYWLVT